MTDRNYREDFPLLRNNDTAYIDNAATAQKPQVVIDAEREFYEKSNANPLRGFYPLSLEATEKYESARKVVRDFIRADSEKEIIFTRNTTESLNLVAYSYALNNLKAGDEIAVRSWSTTATCFHGRWRPESQVQLSDILTARRMER